MADADTEARLREAIARYAETMVVERPPVQELLDQLERPGTSPPRKAPRTRRNLMVAACAAMLVGATVVAMWPQSEPEGVSTGRDTEEPPPGECGSRPDPQGVLGSGVLPDGRSWEARVSGWLPVLATLVVVDGQPAVGATWDEDEWSAAVTQGTLTWDFGVYGGGQFVLGMVPAATERVELRTPSGDAFRLCPAAVPGVDAVELVVGPSPVEEGDVEAVALDREGRPVAQGAITLPGRGTPEGEGRWQAIEAGGEAHAPFLVQVDPTHLELPLGDAEPPPSGVEEMVSGGLPSGRWVLEARRVDGEPAQALVRLRAPELSSIDRVTAAELSEDPAWHVGHSISGRALLGASRDDATHVWGVTPPDVATVVVGLDDGRTIDLPTVSMAWTGVEGRVFAGTVPFGAAVTSMEGQTDDEVVRLRATGVEAVYTFDALVTLDAEGFATLATLGPRTEALMAVEAVD